MKPGAPARPPRLHDQALYARALYSRIFDTARDQAHQLGYALMVHGSLARDVDLLAVAWTEKASPPAELAEKLRAFVDGVAGGALFGTDEPKAMPHGRIAWTIHTGAFSPAYIDLSVIPPRGRETTW